MQLMFIILLLFAVLIISILFLFSFTNIFLGKIGITAIMFQGLDDIGKIKDNIKDTKLITLHKTNIIPKVEDHHDILSIDINKGKDNKILFTINLAGDANKNENYETVYVWLIYYYTSTSTNITTASTDTNNFHLYSIIIPNFKVNMENKKDGWYLAIFNNTNNSYTLPLSPISHMPANKVQVFIDPVFLGNPSLTFNYSVSSLIRVNNTFLDKPPDYLVDYVPNSFNSFWEQWFG
jgi:hypothetical protein